MTRRNGALGFIVGAATVFGCSGTENAANPRTSDQSTGANAATGGASASGGSTSTNVAVPSGGVTSSGSGGTTASSPPTTGGKVGSGGAPPTGGLPSTGGQTVVPSTGGAIAIGGTNAGGATGTGGAAVGGSNPTGGAKATSGGSPSGGTKATGGATVSPGGSTATGGSPGGGGFTSSCGAGTSTPSDIVVNLSSVQQKISGFGASTAWGSSMSTADADTLWSTTSGAGLSLHRIRIDTTGTGTSETSIAKLAVARGVTIWATPWTPPAADKDNNNTVMGHLSNGQDFANKLKTFVGNMKNQGINIYAVSAQNEPDANVTYESCVYTGTTIASFVADYIGPALTGTVKIMAPETQNWCGFQTFWPLIKANTTAMGYLDIIATHEYGCSAKAYPDVAQAGKEFWETEIYDTNTNTDDGMGSALRVTKLIHDALTIANMNAWHYWWVYGGQNGGLFNNATNPAHATKRVWIMGNYSRFVRPGFQRVGTSGTVPSNVWLSAFKSPTDGSVVVVAANNGTSAANISLFISGAAPCSMTPYVTSASANLAAGSPVSVSGSHFSASLEAQSVTTFVGKL